MQPKITASQVTVALSNMTDVAITSPATSQVLTYNGTSWVNAAAATGLPWITVAGFTDTEIGAAVTAVNATTAGAVLYFPTGVYTSAGGYTFTKSVTIIGDGTCDDLATFALSWIKCTSTTADMFTFSVNTSHVYNIFIQNTASSAPTAGVGLHFTHGDGTRMCDVTVMGFFNNFEFDNAGEWFMDRCFSYAFVNYGLVIQNIAVPDGGDQFLSNFSSVSKTYTALAHIHYVSGGGLKINNMKINSRGGVSAVTGIDVNISSGTVTTDFLVSNCSIENVSGNPIKIRSSGGSMQNILINNVQCGEYGTAMVDIAASSTGQFDRLIINGLLGTGGSGAAIVLNTIDNVAIGPCVMYGHSKLLDLTSVTNITNTNAYVGTLTAPDDGTHINLDCANNINFHLSLSGDRELLAPINVSSGTVVNMRVITNGHNLTYDSNFKFSGGTAPTLSSTGFNTMSFHYDGFDNSFALVNVGSFA